MGHFDVHYKITSNSLPAVCTDAADVKNSSSVGPSPGNE